MRKWVYIIMKKFLIILLALAMVLSLAACGEDGADGRDDGPSVSAGDKGETPEGPGTPEKPEEPDEPEALDTPEEPETPEVPEEEPPEDAVTFEGLLAVDNDQCSINITSIETDPIWGYTLKTVVENKSGEKIYMFSVESATVNGVMCDPFFASEVAPGKKSNEEISISDSAFRDNDIGEYTDIALSFRVYDSGDWTAEPVARETVHVYPYGQERAAAYVRESKPEDVVLVDNDSVTVIATGYTEDPIWGWTVELYLVNKTDKSVMFSAQEASVNGFMVDPFFATEVSSGACAFAGMSWSKSSFEENSITEVEEVEFELKAYDSNDWLADPMAQEVVTLNP